MRSWNGDKEIPPLLKEGEKPEVEWSHDESIYRAHDRRMTRWIHEGETSALYKKGEGVSLMVADIVSGEYGFLQRTPETLTGNKDDELSIG